LFDEETDREVDEDEARVELVEGVVVVLTLHDMAFESEVEIEEDIEDEMEE
jgi:hypothetical protein